LVPQPPSRRHPLQELHVICFWKTSSGYLHFESVQIIRLRWTHSLFYPGNQLSRDVLPQFLVKLGLSKSHPQSVARMRPKCTFSPIPHLSHRPIRPVFNTRAKDSISQNWLDLRAIILLSLLLLTTIVVTQGPSRKKNMSRCQYCFDGLDCRLYLSSMK